MASINLKNKSKADLVALVRVSGIMPVSHAHKMTKADLIARLEELEQTGEKNLGVEAREAAEANLVESAPGQLAARKLTAEKKTSTRKPAPVERRSVMDAVEEDEDKKTGKPRPSVMAPVEEETAKAKPTVTSAARSRRTTSSKMTPAKTEETTELGETKTKAEDAAVSVSPEVDDSVKKPAEAKKPAETKKPATTKKPAETGKDAAVEEVAADAKKTDDAKPADAKKTASRKAASSSRKSKAKPVVEAATESSEKTDGEQQTVEASEQKTDTKTNERQSGRGQNKRQRGARQSRGTKAAEDSQASETGAAKSEDATSSKEKERPSYDSGEEVTGVMEIMPDGYGFLRRDNYLQGPKDIYVPPQFIRRFNLREGDLVSGPTRIQRDQDRYQALYFIKTVNGVAPEQMMRRPHFDRLTPIYPNERFNLETTKRELSTRIIDLVAPIGKGQRGMIVSPPKAGKTILLQKIANAISINNPEAKLIVLLIDERPEEVTDMQRSIKGEVVYSTFDKTPENHVKITELVLERAERLVEMGEDVIILMDSLTRMARAYNLTINPTGRTLSGGLDPGALYGPKRFFGAARNIEGGGSLTIVATALIDTGSRMDEVIFEEFKGTGNMEVYLDRKLSEKRIFPAIDINRSGTRREELLLSKDELEAIWSIRKAFGQLDSSNVTETIMNLLMKTNDNQHFVSSINVSLNNKSLYESMKSSLNKSGRTE